MEYLFLFCIFVLPLSAIIVACYEFKQARRYKKISNDKSYQRKYIISLIVAIVCISIPIILVLSFMSALSHM